MRTLETASAWCQALGDRSHSRLARVTWYSREDAAERAEVEPSYLVRLVDLGVLAPEEPDRFSPGDVRRVLMAKSLEDAGVPLDGVAAAIQRGALSLDFLDAASYERFTALAGKSFRQVSDRTGIPLELLTAIREAIGMAPPSPDDRLREDEMAIVPFIELQVAEGFRPSAIEKLLRVHGDSTRRMTEQEGAWWNSEVIQPAMATGARLVQRSSVQHGGKPIKWLGDGVMFYFGDPGPGVRAALQMVDGLAAAGLPPAHVGLHAGPVLFQEGDYFGQTVNLTARIADYARPGEVLVTQAVADASREKGIAFGDIGLVELKGVSDTVHLLRAHLA